MQKPTIVLQWTPSLFFGFCNLGAPAAWRTQLRPRCGTSWTNFSQAYPTLRFGSTCAVSAVPTRTYAVESVWRGVLASEAWPSLCPPGRPAFVWPGVPLGARLRQDSESRCRSVSSRALPGLGRLRREVRFGSVGAHPPSGAPV